MTNWRWLSRSSCGLRGVRQLGESAWALASRHMLGIFELRCDALTHVGHLCFVGLLLVAVDGSPHQLGHLRLELLSLLSRLNFGLLKCNNAFSDLIDSTYSFCRIIFISIRPHAFGQKILAQLAMPSKKLGSARLAISCKKARFSSACSMI